MSAAQFLPFVQATAPAYGLSADLVSRVIQAESAWNPRARSHANAQGLMQLIPGTAKEMGVTDVWNPEQNMHGGMKYLAQQLQEFGDVPSALAAYNWGPGRVREAKRKYGSDWLQYAPKETRDYVAKITGTPMALPGIRPPVMAPVTAPDVTTNIPPGILAPQQTQAQPAALFGGMNPETMMGLFGLSMIADAAVGRGNGVGGMGNALAMLGQLQQMQQVPSTPPVKRGTTTIENQGQKQTYLTENGVPVRLIASTPTEVVGAEGMESAMKPSQVISAERGMVQEYRKDTARSEEILTQFNDVADYDPRTMTGAQDRNLIVAFAKAADPTSAVMEGEAEVIEQAGQKMPWLTSWYHSTFDRNLTKGQRANLLEELHRRAGRAAQSNAATWQQYLTRLQGYTPFGVDPMRVLPKNPTPRSDLSYDPGDIPRGPTDTVPEPVQKALDTVEGLLPGGAPAPSPVQLPPLTPERRNELDVLYEKAKGGQ